MRELKRGLFDTFREAVSPLVEKDLAKLTRLAESFSGYSFYPVTLPSAGPRMDMVDGRALIVHKEHQEWRACSAVCPLCSHLLHYMVHSGKLKCFSCEADFSLQEDKALTRFPVKQEKGRVLVGLPRREGG
jgi:nitrite reductase/ring-hydroxylating ferredoxin subunit